MKLFSIFKRSFKTIAQVDKDFLDPRNLKIGIVLNNKLEDAEELTPPAGVDIITYIGDCNSNIERAEKDECDVLITFDEKIALDQGVYCLNRSEDLDLAHEIAKTNELQVVAKPLGLSKRIKFSGIYIRIGMNKEFKRKKTVAYDVIRWATKADLL